MADIRDKLIADLWVNIESINKGIEGILKDIDESKSREHKKTLFKYLHREQAKIHEIICEIVRLKQTMPVEGIIISMKQILANKIV